MSKPQNSSKTSITLRDVQPSDLPIFFEQQRDPLAVHMAAFTAKEPANRAAFDAFWARISANPTVTIRTIDFEGQVAGSVLKYDDEGHPEVSYWLGREFWGKGIATHALQQFLQVVTARPIYARAASDNFGSIRVLEKCGFRLVSENSGFANARGGEIPEVLMVLNT